MAPLTIRLALAAALAWAASGVVFADGEPYARVYGPNEKVKGKTLGEWSAAWWQWAAKFEKRRHPAYDNTGDRTADGQGPDVWFLTGNTPGGKSARRRCEVPEGRPILFPVVAGIEFLNKATEKQQLADLKKYVNGATDMEVTLDGVKIPVAKAFRVQSKGFFEVVGPKREEQRPILGQPEKGTAAADGYWVMLKPLKPGTYTLSFRGRVARQTFSGFYALVVKPAKGKAAP